MNKLLCYLFGHYWDHIANWKDVDGGRALWQCERCKKLIIDASSEFYDKRQRKHPNPKI